jgi:ubiquitin carboxyl-terminal hydrolase 10
LNKPVALLQRPIVNPGNRCYMISVLQTILHTRPLANYLLNYFFHLPGLDSLLETSNRFPLLLAFKQLFSHLTPSSSNNNNPFPHPPTPLPHDVLDEIFLALRDKKCSGFSAAGFNDQEDAEEFLTALLDALGEEFSALRTQKLFSFSLPFERHQDDFDGSFDDDTSDNDWLQVASKNRIATTRRTPVSQSPIHSLFAGSFQSLYRAPSTRPSITFEPFTVLPLSLVRESSAPIESVEDAIAHVLRCEDLGRKCSKQLSFASLPCVLIVQLKRFVYQSQLHKITRPIRIPASLQLSQNNQPIRYQLFALVNHHGSLLNAGHYTATIRTDDKFWSVFDDDVQIQKVDNETITKNVLNRNSSAYLLFYQKE